MSDSKEVFFKTLQYSLAQKTFVKIHLVNYNGAEQELKKIIISPVLIKKKNKLCFVLRYKTKDITKNYTREEAIELLEDYSSLDQFKQTILFTTENDFELKYDQKNSSHLIKRKATFTTSGDTAHDKVKNRKIQAENKSYLQDLKITDSMGKVRPHGQDKFKQINHYIEILSSLLNDLPDSKNINIVDMGSGKGYLTFALYDYLNNNQKKSASITGIEFRKDLVTLCNKIATKSKFENLLFQEGSIENYEATKNLDVLIALHACDTATDDALFKGIQAAAELIVVAPCCHKQIRKEMQKNKAKNELAFITTHGIFMERQAEMVTDSLRALYLEQAGYATKVFEFIATEHTPKNVLIVAQKRKNTPSQAKELKIKIEKSKKYFGIQNHHLELLLEG